MGPSKSVYTPVSWAGAEPPVVFFSTTEPILEAWPPFTGDTVPTLLPLLHPASIVRGRWGEEPAQIAYLKRLARHLKDNTTPTVEDYSVPPPGGDPFPTLKALSSFSDSLGGLHQPCLSYDIESAGPHLLCVGIYQVDLEDWSIGPGLCLPFKTQGGEEYWKEWPDHLAATRWLYDRLADPELANLFHNGVNFDVPMLEDLGFKVEGRLLDTMVMAHYLYPEMRKGLQYLSTLYLGAGVWKTLVEEEEKE